MSQGSRDGVMLGFKGGRVPILVATDVAARGLDISTVTHVVNFDVPRSPDVYVHRIGRTGRVGRAGRAITFVEPRQEKELEAIERHVGIAITPWEPGAHVAAAEDRREAARATRSRRSSTTATSRTRSSSSAGGRVGRHRGRRPRQRRHARRGDRRRGRAQRQGARALRVPVGPRRRRRADRGGGRRRARARPAHPRRAREGLTPPARDAGATRGSSLRSPSMAERNVLGEPLEPCGTDPLTGFYRDGCCSTGPEDLGSHTICAVVTDGVPRAPAQHRQRPLDADADVPLPRPRARRPLVRHRGQLAARLRGGRRVATSCSPRRTSARWRSCRSTALREQAVDVPADPGMLES